MNWAEGVTKTYREELACVLITVTDANGAAVDENVLTHAEVLGHEGSEAVSSQNHLPVEESSLGKAGVHLLGLLNHDALVLEVVVDQQLMDAEVLETALDNRLLEVAVEAKHLRELIMRCC